MRAGLKRLDARDWARLAQSPAGIPPGFQPPIAAALARATGADRAQGMVVATPFGSSAVACVVHDGILGPSVEALPFGIAGGPVRIDGEPRPLSAAGLRRPLRAQRVALSVHHTAAHDDRGDAMHTHVLDLDGGRPRPRERARRRLRAAERAGVDVRVGEPADVPALVAVLAAAAEARSRHSYSDRAVQEMARCDGALVVLASRAGRTVSAGLFLSSPLEVFYWLGGTLIDEEEHSPSHLVIDAAIDLAAERGCRFVDLGSSTGMPGVAFFKEGFGARAVPSPLLVAEAARHRAALAVRGALRRSAAR